MDVGVDTHDFRPWHFDEIRIRMDEKAKTRAAQSNLPPAIDLMAEIDSETPLDVTNGGTRGMVAPVQTSAQTKFEVAQELARERFGNTFKKLAE